MASDAIGRPGFLGQAVAEVILLLVIAHVGKGRTAMN
jgi:hypothetical protein